MHLTANSVKWEWTRVVCADVGGYRWPIHYSNTAPICPCFLDANKPFDRVKNWKLISFYWGAHIPSHPLIGEKKNLKLKTKWNWWLLRTAPKHHISLLISWYINQNISCSLPILLGAIGHCPSRGIPGPLRCQTLKGTNYQIKSLSAKNSPWASLTTCVQICRTIVSLTLVDLAVRVNRSRVLTDQLWVLCLLSPLSTYLHCKLVFSTRMPISSCSPNCISGEDE